MQDTDLDIDICLALQACITHQAEIEKLIQRLESFRGVYRKIIDDVDRLVGLKRMRSSGHLKETYLPEQPTATTTSGATTVITIPCTCNKHSYKSKSLKQCAYLVLKEFGKRKITELARTIKVRGYKNTLDKITTNLSAVLCRDIKHDKNTKFVRVRRGVYCIRG